MYLGASAALGGAAIFYKSVPLAVYVLLFLLAAHAFVVWFEEPTLRATFGSDYDAYCDQVRRWWPRLTRDPGEV